MHTLRHTRKNSGLSTQAEHLVLLGLEAITSPLSTFVTQHALFIFYPYNDFFWSEWILEPFTYPSVVFVFLLCAVLGGVLKLLWLGTKNQGTYQGILSEVLLILFSLPLSFVFWLATFSDYTPYELVCPNQRLAVAPFLELKKSKRSFRTREALYF
jgi:hypothetical protein